MESNEHTAPNIAPDSAPARRSAVDLAANILSWVLVPVLTPVYAIILIFSLSILHIIVPLPTRILVTAVIFGITCVAPALIFKLLNKLGIVSDIALNRRTERPLPYAIVIASYLLTGYYLYNAKAPDWVVMFYLGGAAAAIINLIINFRWKISAHAAGMAGVCAILLRMAHEMPDTATTLWFCAWLLLTGALGASRIWLRRHTLPQVTAGYANGFICVWLATMIHF